MMPKTLEELRQWLVSELPKWLREHPELRYTLEGVLAETFVRRDEWQNLMKALERLAEGQQELQQTLQEVLRQQAEHSQALRALQEQQAEHSRILQEHSRILQEHTRILQEHTAILREHTQALRALQEQQAEHTRILQEHTQALRALQEQQAEHSRILQEQTRVLQEHTQALRALQEQQAEHSRVLQEHARALQEQAEAIIGMQRRLIEHSEAIRSLQEEQAKHSELLRRLDSKIGALGRRWGLLSEAAFREGMYELLTPYGFRVERFWARDEEGFVFGRPEQIEIDLLVRNETTIAAEIRSSVSKADVWVFLRKVEFLERLLNRKIDRRAIISPFVDDDALEFAQQTGVEVFTAPEELRNV